MFKLEFDITNPVLTLAFAKALQEVGEGTPVLGKLKPATETVVVMAGKEGTVVEHHVTSAEFDQLAAEQEDLDAGKSVDTATGPGSSTTNLNSADAGANTSQKLDYDTKGVPFIPAICAKAAKPFYASGPYVGQWKKGTKVSQEEYDRVYGEALAKVLAGVQTGRVDGTVENQTNIGKTIQNSPAADVFGGQQQGNAIDETIKENPVSANDVFALYGELCAKNGAVAANGICAAAGIENGTLIFSRPDLVDELFKSLTTLKHALANQGG
jgi:hypothetical protein